VFLVGSATKVRLVTGNAGVHVLLRCCIFHPVKHTQWRCAETASIALAPVAGRARLATQVTCTHTVHWCMMGGHAT
jgi:hypothetical protein